MQIRGARPRKTTILFGFIVTSLLIQIHAKELSIENDNKNKHQLRRSTILAAKSNHLVELYLKEAVTKYQSAQPQHAIQDDIKQVDTSLLLQSKKDKDIRPAYSIVHKLLMRTDIPENKDKKERTGFPSIDESFVSHHRVLRDFDEDDVPRNVSEELDIITEGPRTSTVEQRETLDDKGNGITSEKVTGRGKRSNNCPKSPEGEVECCIPSQDEFLPESLVYEHTDESGKTCTCDLCRAPQYMNGSCVCTPTGGEVSCVSSVKGKTYMPLSNKCFKPFQCTSVCPGNMVVIKECETDKDSDCGCDEDNGFYQTGETTCAKIPKCDDNFKLELDSHPGAKYTSYSCVPCRDDEKCITVTPKPTVLEHTDGSSTAINANASPSHTTRSSSSDTEQQHTSMIIEDSTKLPTPQPAPETNEAAEDETILDNNSQIVLLVVVGALSTLLVIFGMAVIVVICCIFSRNADDGRPIINRIRYHQGAVGEDGYVDV